MRKPIVRVIGQAGSDLIPGWGPTLTRVSFTDNDGGEADEIEIEFAVDAPFQAPPEEGTRYRLLYSWSESGLRDAGDFTFQSAALGGDADGGYLLTIVARSADFVEADKTADSEHFDDMTAGEIFQKLAGAAGKSAVVDPSIASIKLPYRLRHQQSALGFAQELADELGATLKLAGGKWLLPARGSGKTAGGSAMPPILVDFSQTLSFDLSSEGRPKFKDVNAAWFDPEAGVAKIEKAASIGKSALHYFLHPSASAEEAKIRSKAEAKELERATISGSLTVEGDPGAMAGAPVVLSGFGGWNGFDLVAPSIRHDFTFDDQGGWIMNVALAAKSKTG